MAKGKTKSSGFQKKQEPDQDPFITNSVEDAQRKVNVELDQERQQIESIKQRESQHVLTPEQFEASRRRVETKQRTAVEGDSFAFKAGRDKATGKRYFNVRGKADPRQIYRAAKYVSGPKTYYFFGENFDKLYLENSDRILTVNAWINLFGKWELSPIAKGQIKNVVTISIDEASQIYEAIKAQGKNPGA